MLYWLYRTHIYTWRNQYVQARLASPKTSQPSAADCGFGFLHPNQDGPYGVNLQLTYEINPKHPMPDNYFAEHGFSLYSERLVDLLLAYDTKCEVFPVVLVDSHGIEVTPHRYFVFHSLEGTVDAMDEDGSEWSGNRSTGIPRLVLRNDIVPKPIFTCSKIFVALMRDDIRESIRSHGLTGFDFLSPSRFRSGIHGSRPNYDD